MASSITSTATHRKRRLDIRTGNDKMASAVMRTPGDGKPRSREDISAEDLRHIQDRQEAEALPEGDVRRKRKRGAFGY